MKRVSSAALALVALLAVGCSKPPDLMMQRLAPEAPASLGLPPAPLPDSPTPLADRPPFGLYATYPSRDTLDTLSTGTLSPDGRFRAVMTDQGVWVTRIDGAWLWQVALPTPDPNAQPAVTKAPDPKDPKQTVPVQAAAPKATKFVLPMEWTTRHTLLLRDDTGTWLEANPEDTSVKPLPAALQGKDGLLFSPDGKQVLYYMPGKTGRQLWLASADGTKPALQGENLTGYWDPTGKLVTQKVTTTQPGAQNKQDLAPDLRVGPDTL